MAKATTIKGKGFEFAVLEVLKTFLNHTETSFKIEESKAYANAKKCFNELDIHAQEDYKAAAMAGVFIIKPFEPRLTNTEENEPLILRIQGDAQGQKGDVRDVICIRSNEGWEIGISCKHNHEALKHPRITSDADFGTHWIQTPSSEDFQKKIYNVMDIVETWLGSKWSSHPDKHEVIYKPILDAYTSEIRRLCDINKDTPSKLVKYFFGSDDFYKVIAKDRRGKGIAGSTEVVAFNMNGTLGQSAKERRSIRSIPRVKMPSRLIEACIKPGSHTTILMTFDEGWAISMRLHSADSKVSRTGLKWDVQLAGMPNGLYKQAQPWLTQSDIPTPRKDYELSHLPYF